MPEALRGIHAALVTPMNDDQEIDYTALAAFVDHLIERGVKGLIPLGSTGEFYALSWEERCRVVDVTIEANCGRVPVLVGANGGSTREVVKHCQYAQESGASGVLLAAPYYSLPTEVELYEHFSAVEAAIDIPIMLYNYPGRTGVDMTPSLIERLARHEKIRYVKESTGDISRVGEIIRRCGDAIEVLCGSDALALESFRDGAVGWVTGAANVLPSELARLHELACIVNDMPKARELSDRLFPVLSHFEEGLYTQKVKAGCALRGHPVGPPRRPLLPLSEKGKEELSALLKTACTG